MQMNISVAQLKEQLVSGKRIELVDVRDEVEVRNEAVPNAINIPLTDLSDALLKMDPAEAVFFICKTGLRSQKAAAYAKSFGIEKAFSVEGGVVAWLADD